MPPRFTSARSSGASSPGQWGSGYRTPGNRKATFTVSYTNNVATLPDRLARHFQHALIFHLEDAAQRVVDTARGYLVRLEEPPRMVNSAGREIHGYDTGQMYVSLKYDLMEPLLMLGVFYELLSEEADYWRFVEFGHWVFSASGPWFWPGYHFLATAIEANEGYIRQRCREAWADTAIVLAMEARVTAAEGRLALTRNRGLAGIPNVAGVRP